MPPTQRGNEDQGTGSKRDAVTDQILTEYFRANRATEESMKEVVKVLTELAADIRVVKKIVEATEEKRTSALNQIIDKIVAKQELSERNVIDAVKLARTLDGNLDKELRSKLDSITELASSQFAMSLAAVTNLTTDQQRALHNVALVEYREKIVQMLTDAIRKDQEKTATGLEALNMKLIGVLVTTILILLAVIVAFVGIKLTVPGGFSATPHGPTGVVTHVTPFPSPPSSK